MSQWGSEDNRNVYAGLNSKGQGDRAGWLKPAATALGAGAGFLVGGPAGAMAGSQLGGAAGGIGHDAANGQLTPQGVMGSAMEGVSGYQGLDKAMQAKALIEAFMQNPHQFRLGFATGGPVLSPSMDPNLLQRLLYGSQGAGVPSGPTQTPQGDLGASSDVLGAIPGQVQQMIGQPPAQPTPNPLQQAQHPTLEALSALLPQIMAAMPRPANPKNTKAIGAWLPAAGLALSAPAAVAQSRRASANAPIQAGNESRQADYEARRKAYEAQRGTLMNTLAGNATKPFADRATDAVLSLDMAKRLGHAEWAGLTESQVRLKMQGAPDTPKPKEPPSPKDRAGLANMILDNVRQDPDIKNFVTVRDNYGRISRMARNGSGVGDMSLIFAYMKVLDPTSVVRESEYKNAADAIGKIPQLGNIPANWMSGSKLTPAGRAGFVKAAQQLYETSRANYRAAISMHRGFANEYGIDPRLVLRNYESLDAQIPEATGGAAPQGPSAPAAGTRIR